MEVSRGRITKNLLITFIKNSASAKTDMRKEDYMDMGLA
jgi:hypothetical protein